MSQSVAPRIAEPRAKLSTDGRFEIQEVLGAGGMGAVYRANAPGLGRQVALKRLVNSAKPKHVALFEREYHTLVSLKHPNVVEVLDYGTDSDGPWYAMELLEGSDLARAAPLAWPEVCRILRELSSALAAVHARRLLHRDISARNVWRTPEGRIKVIDFGALCGFGPVSDVAGTPPFVAPEAVHGRLLDQRTDLYSTGVLGYYLLTGLYPFPAREFADLEKLWQKQPKPASERIGELCRSDLPAPPAELDVLIEALLSRDPLARPGSAAELIERLDAIVAPGSDGSGAVVEGSLRKTAFVGRGAIIKSLERALELATQSLGSAAMIEAEAGLGRTRLLTEFALGARFSGAVALQVDPAPYRGQVHGVAQAFGLRLLDTLPELSRRLAAPHAPVLGHVSEALRERLGLAPELLTQLPDAPGEARMRMQVALASWFLDVAKERTLVLLADDVQLYDEPSAAWLASLARSASGTKLLVVGTLRGDVLEPLARNAGSRTKLDRGPAVDEAALSVSESPSTETLLAILATGPSHHDGSRFSLDRGLSSDTVAAPAQGAPSTDWLDGIFRAGSSHAERPVQGLRQAATPFLLAPLASGETLELMRSILGEAPRLGRLAETLHRVSGGTPAYALELVEHLVHRGSVVYSDGAWVLPQDLDAAELPQTRGAALAARLSRLSPEARAIAQMLSLIQGRISLDAVKALAPYDTATTFAALELLVNDGVLARAEGDYAFAHDAVRKLLDSELDAPRRAAAHRTLGELLLTAERLSAVDQLRAGVHLMLSGMVERGSQLAWQACCELAINRLTDLPVCIEQMELALQLQRAHKRPLREQLGVLAAVTTAGFHVERRLAFRYGPDALAALEGVVELPLARRLRPWLGRMLAMLVALAWAALRISIAGRRGRGLSFQHALTLLFACVACMTGVYTICIDGPRAARTARVLEPLSVLGKNHVAGLMYEFCCVIAATASDRLGETYARWQALTERFKSVRPTRELPEALRMFYMAGGMYAQGVMASWRDDARALRIADELEGLKVKLFEVNADQVRMMYYGNQGDRALFDHYRERVETHAIQCGTAWQAETWAAAAQLTVYLRTYDGTRMKHCIEQLQRVGTEVPSMAEFVDRARAFYLMLRDKPRQAEGWLAACLSAEPLEVAAWAGWCGALARAYNATGQYERTRALCRHVLSYLSSEDRAFPAMNLIVETELALAEANLGDCASALAMIDELLALHAPNEGALTLGSIHDTGASIALLAGDRARFERHLAGVEQYYRPTKTASLIARCERLAKQRPRAAQAVQRDDQPSTEVLPLHTVLYRLHLGGSGSPIEQTRWALAEFGRSLQLGEGYAYLVDEQETRRIAGLAEEPDEQGARGREPLTGEELTRLDTWVGQRMVARRGTQTMTAAAQDLAALMTINQIELDSRRFRLLFLHVDESLVGGLVVATEVAESIPHAVLEAVAGRLRTLTIGFRSEPSREPTTCT